MTDWREELIEKMANAMLSSKGKNEYHTMMDMTRAALEVAEPVIREQCAEMADAIAKDYRVYRDHYPHAEGAEQVATAIREKRSFATEGGKG